MKTPRCNVCSYSSLDGTKPEKCPVCGNNDWAEMEIQEQGELSAKHIPVVKVNKTCSLIEENCQDVVVKIGEVTHPMEEDHFIVFFDVYKDKKWQARMQLSPDVNPGGAVHMKSGTGKLAIVELCNKHGA
jgi:superoxide reductase